MVGAVVQRDLDVDHRITGEHAATASRPGYPASTAGIYSLGIAPPTDRVDELVALAGLVGLNVDLDVTVLALTAGLAGILGVLIDGLA